MSEVPPLIPYQAIVLPFTNVFNVNFYINNPFIYIVKEKNGRVF